MFYICAKKKQKTKTKDTIKTWTKYFRHIYIYVYLCETKWCHTSRSVSFPLWFSWFQTFRSMFLLIFILVRNVNKEQQMRAKRSDRSILFDIPLLLVFLFAFFAHTRGQSQISRKSNATNALFFFPKELYVALCTKNTVRFLFFFSFFFSNS